MQNLKDFKSFVLDLQIIKRLESDFLHLQNGKDLAKKRMPQRHREHRDGEEESGLRNGVKVQGEPARRKGESFVATFMNNDRKKRSEKQLSVRADLEQLYL